MGLATLMVLVMFGFLLSDWLIVNYDDTDEDSMIYIFPIFRGVGLFILYFWGCAWNIYGFNKFKVNYRFILDYGSHYSTYFQIMKRAGFFTMVFIFMLLFYFIGDTLNDN